MVEKLMRKVKPTNFEKIIIWTWKLVSFDIFVVVALFLYWQKQKKSNIFPLKTLVKETALGWSLNVQTQIDSFKNQEF